MYGRLVRVGVRVALASVLVGAGSASPAHGNGPSGSPSHPGDAALGPDDWHEWRGPAGLGVSPSRNLPTELDAASPALRWKAEVPGEGISSPIVVGERVFVTTAYAGAEESRAQALLTYGFPALVALVLALGAWLALRRRESAGTLARLDGALVALVTLASLGAAALAVYAPRTFPSWGPGVLGWGWFYTGAIGAAGLFAAVGWARARSPLRLLGALALGALAVYLWQNIGLNSYGQSFRVRYRAVMVAPCVLGALWHVVVWLGSARSTASGRGSVALGGVALAGAMALVFVTLNLVVPRAGTMRAVLCFDLASGRELWHVPLFVAPQEQKYDINSFATPTPTSDGRSVFVYFGSGWACLDLEGHVLWQGRDEAYAPNTRYGCGSSPVLFEDTFVVLQEKEYVRPSYIAAFEAASGRERWRVNPSYASDSYCTPLLLPRPGGIELVTASAERAVAHDPRNGELLWSVPLPIRQMVPSLCYTGDLLLVAGGTHTKTSASGVRLAGSGKATEAEVTWQSTRCVPEVASPVLVDGLLFVVNDTGILGCLDAATGEFHYRERLEAGHRYWSSLVAGDGKVYACSDEGVITVVAAKPEFEVLGRGELNEACAATPAISRGRLLVRTAAHLWCFAAPGEG